MSHDSLVQALLTLGFNGGWLVTDGVIELWERDEPQPTEAELLAHRKQLRDEERRDEIKQIRIANQQYDQSIRKLAQSFAKEKNYITWQPEFYDEVKNRFGLSKKKTVAVFLPVYVSEVSHFQLFQ